MLVKCPECSMQISDKASFCPHCGYPIQKQSSYPRISRRRRLPNGFGQISEIKNKRLKKPFRVLVTIGKGENGRPICKLLKPEAYFSTYNEAYNALMEYHRDPFDLTMKIPTMNELYVAWSESYYKTLSSNSYKQYVGAWMYCSSIYKLKITDLKVKHIKDCVENGCKISHGKAVQASPSRQVIIKVLFGLLCDYAVSCDYIKTNPAKLYKLPKKILKDKEERTVSHKTYTDEEMELLWQNINNYKGLDMVLIQCYSGWRPQELCNLLVADININNWSMTGGMKTDAGRNRTIPIHPKVRELVLRNYKLAIENGSKYLFNVKSTKEGISYESYRILFNNIIVGIGLDPSHKPHDARKFFVTNAKRHHVDEYAIKYLVGHAITDITEKVYTDRDFDWLISEMKKIK